MTHDHKKKILLVDDEAIIAMSESKMLENHGYDVLTVYSGEAAVQKAAERADIDLVLMDIDLGSGMDGTEAAEIILKTRDIPVLFLSSHTEPEVVDKTEKITSYGYVVKNSGATVILASIKMAFKLHEAHRELRKREEELAKSRWKLNFIFDNTPNAITVTEMETGIVVEANKGIEWTGWTKEDVLGKSPQILQAWVHPDESERIRNIIKARGKLTDHRVDFYKKDGSIAHVLLNSVFLHMDGRQYLLTVSNDITRITEYEKELQNAKTDLEAMNEELNATVEELEATNEELMATIAEVEETRKDLEDALAEGKKAEEALRFKNLLLSTQQESSVDGILVVGETGEILSYNSMFADMWGIPADILATGSDRAALDHILGKLVNPEQSLKQILHLYAHRTETSRDEMIFRDGRVFERFSSPMVDTHGAYQGRVWYFRDISEQKRAENALRRSEERFSELVRFLPETVYEADHQGMITYVNQTGLDLFGYTQEEVDRELNVLSIIAPQSQKRAVENIGILLQGGYLGLNEYLAIKKDGTTFPVLIHSSVILRDGKPDGFRGFVVDISEIRKVESSLAESEARYRSVINSIPIGIHRYRLEPGGRLVFDGANPAADRILGVDNGLFIGKTIEEAFPALVATEAPRRYREAAEKGAPWHTEQIDYDENEIRGAFDVHAFRIGDRLMAAAFTDITDRKKTEKALLDNQRLLNTVYDNVGAYIFMKDTAYRYTFANKKCCDLFGKDLPDIIGKTDVEFFSADSIPEIMKSDRRVIEQGETVTREETNLASPDGTGRRTYWTVKLPLRDSEGAIYALCGISTDITKLKQAEEALRESEDRWQFALEGAGDGLWDWNARTDRVYFSHQWKAMIGYDDDEIGDTLHEWDSRIHPDDRERVYAELNKHLEGAIPVYTTEHRMKCKNGEYKWVLDRGKVISRTPEGKPLRVIGTHTDITILKAIQEALGKAVGEKEALLRELQHRMKNSLTMINSIINLEIDRLKHNDMVGVLHNIQGRLESLASLYELLFQSDTFKEVDLGDYLKSIVRLLSGSYGAASSGIRVEEEFEPMRVNAKSAAAWGLIANELLTNSFKYAFPKGGTGTIRINLKKRKNEIILIVADDGAGMPPDFDIDNPRGLGLLLVKTLSLQLKGSLTFERGRETMFQVRVSISSEA